MKLETYEAILERMRAEYQSKSGAVPEEASDVGLRLQILAGELYRMQAGVEWLKRQAFPQTADGAQLDLHGAQRGVARGGPAKAAGVVTFSRYIPMDFDLIIPQGTVCSASGGEAVEYETTQEGVLEAGEVSVDVPVRAVLPGSGGNAAAGAVNTLVSSLVGIHYLVNQEPITGGEDPEDDESYRRRVLAAYSRLVQCGNAAYYEELALAHKGITSAQTAPREDGAGTVSVYVWGDGAAPSQEVLDSLSQELNELREIGVTVTVKAATTKKVNVMGFIKLKPGAVYAESEDRLKTALAQWFSHCQVGDPVYLGDLSRVILQDPAVSAVTFSAATKETAAALGVIPVLGSVAMGNST